MYFNGLLTFLLLLLVSSSDQVVDSDDVENVFELTTKVFDVISKSWVVAEKVEERTGEDGTPLIWFTKKKERLLLNSFGRIAQLIHTIQKETNDVRSMMLGSLKKLQYMPNAFLNGIQINELLESVRSLENDFKNMEEYKLEANESNIKYSSYTIEKFADAMLSYSLGSPSKQLAKIHSFIVPDWDGFKFHTHGGIFNILKHTMEDSDLLCDQPQSLQQLIYTMYLTLHTTQLKGYSVMQYSWMLLKAQNKSDFEFERNKHTANFKKNILKQLEVLNNSMSSANNIYYKCDPQKHIQGKTYAEITKLLQGYIENEADMNYEQSCMKNCAYYEVAEHKSCFRDQFCAKQYTCSGRILNCQFFDSDMRLCQSKLGSNRRYDYIAYKNGKVLGDASSECKGTMSNVDSWWMYLLWHCSYCFCICDSTESSSDRYFSLKDSVSNIEQNKVVTGIRFTKVNQMFHIQVEQGFLGSKGTIKDETREWVPVPGPEFSFKNTSLKSEVDYHILTYTERAIDLDNLIVPENTVVTGVRFRRLGSHLNLQVRYTSFNFSSGNLTSLDTSNWFGDDNTELTDTPRTEIDINNSDLPTKIDIPSELDTVPNKFIKFTYSSIEYDVAQTTLPFIDIQPVLPYPGVPLSGIGVYFKQKKKHAGFIGPSVFTYNFSNSLNFDLFSKLEK